MQAQDHLPLTETTLFILLSLAATPKHGYAIIKEVEAMSAGRVVLATGTLYSALRRLLEDGWIERVEDAPPQNGSLERKRYRLTDFGRKILDLESERLKTLVSLISVRSDAGG
ncbi:MAG: PadR family transcriptional regulator [Anaerolineales bacterium]|nr:PadR family transcriptional regulator [Anaerolineales bacterium]